MTAAALIVFVAGMSFAREAPHNPGGNCLACHPSFTAAGTVFKTAAAEETAPDVPVVFTGPDGAETVMTTNGSGNLATDILRPGRYLIRTNAVTSRTWHGLPAQAECNACHKPGGNATGLRTQTLHAYHTRVPDDNGCGHCHHFPASQSLEKLRTTGVLQTASSDPPVPGSRVEILGRVYDFDPSEYAIQTTRPDIFAPGFYSMFDVIIAVARRNNIRMSCRFDLNCMTYFIRSIEGRGDDYWYRFSYDAGNGNAQELNNRRAVRWDEALWRPGVWIQVTRGENLGELKAAYAREIARERAQGHIVPQVRISINPSNFQGNPTGSGRTTVTREFFNVKVTPHDWRSTAAADPNPKPFRPGVVTSMDILLSLRDQGALDLVSGAFYTYFAGHYIHSYYVVALGFPGVGTSHASGRHGFIYTTENGTPNRLPNSADARMHITSDIHVLHAPDFSSWRWAELGNPYYENTLPGNDGLMRASIAEDFEAIGRGFSLHAPVVLLPGERSDTTTPTDPPTAGGEIGLSFNVFEPGDYRLEIRDDRGNVLKRLIDGRIDDLGIVRMTWAPDAPAGGRFTFVLTDGKHTQVRDLARETPDRH